VLTPWGHANPRHRRRPRHLSLEARQLLESEGFTVVSEAFDGQTALSLVGTDPPEVVRSTSACRTSMASSWPSDW